jgi:hypothetical protein
MDSAIRKLWEVSGRETGIALEVTSADHVAPAG